MLTNIFLYQKIQFDSEQQQKINLACLNYIQIGQINLDTCAEKYVAVLSCISCVVYIPMTVGPGCGSLPSVIPPSDPRQL